ncbi:hypothetical protein ACFPQA_17260 [Marinobacter koreensis]|uniref:Uncharacterized protein n=1 Tax=Marinobacter koreensis TaxID=335974 RepID=A0ABW0RTJ0_9GAMM|nr:hypothetical protein [Marinobacter koreensis]MCK7549053.1 hypothetical protein [Marinobacter koreensis]
MSTLASERSWLLDPNLLKLVHQCRRLIQSEFGVKLHLTEQHLEERLADYAGKTRSPHLIRTWEALKAQVPQLSVSTDPGEGQPKRLYRGQVIEEEPGNPAGAAEPDSPPLPRKTKVIYRGQVIE